MVYLEDNKNGSRLVESFLLMPGNEMILAALGTDLEIVTIYIVLLSRVRENILPEDMVCIHALGSNWQCVQ